MDPFENITSRCDVLSTAARLAFKRGDIDNCSRFLSELLCFLLDELVGQGDMGETEPALAAKAINSLKGSNRVEF